MHASYAEYCITARVCDIWSVQVQSTVSLHVCATYGLYMCKVLYHCTCVRHMVCTGAKYCITACVCDIWSVHVCICDVF